MEDNLMNKRKLYYTNIGVQFELIHAMKDREVIFMDRKDNWKCIRGISIKSIEYLNKFFEYFDFFKKDYNIYISTAKYTQIPMFTLDLSKRQAETSKWFNEHAESMQYDYNILFDFDSKYRVKTNKVEEHKTILSNGKEQKYYSNKWEWVYNRLQMRHDILRLLSIIPDKPYYIIPSGNNFQIVYNNITKATKEHIKEYISNIKEVYKLNHIDLAGCGHPFKIMKCPYSLVNDIVCYPINIVSERVLSDYDYFDSNNILKNHKLGYRKLPSILNNRGWKNDRYK